MRYIKMLPTTMRVRIPVIRGPIVIPLNVDDLADMPIVESRDLALTRRMHPDGYMVWAAYDQETDTLFLRDDE